MGLPFAAWDGHFAAQAKRTTGDVAGLRRRLSPRQLKMLQSNAKRQVRKPGRRGGKTDSNATELVETACKHPGAETSVYITLTKHHSRRNLEREIEVLIKQHELPFTRSEVDGQLYYTHQNGHAIWLTGCKDKSEADKLRGNKYRLAIVDEAGSGLFNRVIKGDVEGKKAVTLLQYLCQSVLGPALSDLGGRLVVSGTPWVLQAGYFYEISTGNGRPKWETYTWTVLDNPFHRYSPLHPEHDEAAFIREAVEDWGCEVYTDEERAQMLADGTQPPYPELPWLKKATASFEREWLSLWVHDVEALCYAYDESRNSFHAAEAQGLISRDAQGRWVLPPGDWRHILSIDLGHDDATTFTVASSRRNFPHVYFRKSYGLPAMTTSQRAAEAHRLRNQYGVTGDTIVDEGGLGKAIAHDMTTDYRLPCVPAEKTAKASAIRNLADAERRGLVFYDTRECAELIAEHQTVTWNAERTDHDPSCPDDCSDGGLYNYRAHPKRETWDREPPAPGTREAIDAAQRARKAQVGKRAAILRDESLSPAQRRAKLRREGLGR